MKARSLRVGQPAPDFSLTDPISGEPVSLADFAGQSILVVFVRGTWCPFCRRQLARLADAYGRLQAARIATLAVACQNPATVRRYLDAHPLPFALLADEARTVAKAYGTHYWLRLDGFNLSHPALFILAPDRTVRFVHIGAHMNDLPLDRLLDAFVGFLPPDSPRVVQ